MELWIVAVTLQSGDGLDLVKGRDVSYYKLALFLRGTLWCRKLLRRFQPRNQERAAFAENGA